MANTSNIKTMTNNAIENGVQILIFDTIKAILRLFYTGKLDSSTYLPQFMLRLHA